MKKIWKSYGSSILLLLAMVVGGIVGYYWGPGVSVLQPIADTFLNLLFVSVVPLIFCSLTSSIARMTDIAKLKRILTNFVLGLFITGIITSIFFIVPLIFIDPVGSSQIPMAKEVTEVAQSVNILSMFTVDDFYKLFSRSNLMALIVFSLLFSFAIIKLGDKGRPVVRALELTTEIIIQMIGIFMKLAPIGLGSYFAILIGTNGSEMIGPMARTVGIYLVIFAIYIVCMQTFYGYVADGPRGAKRWWKTGVTPTLTALATCSSAASLPANLQQSRELGIPKEIADLVIPLGATLHKNGALSAQILKIAFICSVMNVEFASVTNIGLTFLVSMICAIVVGGIPGGGYVAEIIIMSVFGFPQTALPMMVMIGTLTDAPATVMNVTGDTGLAMVIARIIEGKKWVNEEVLQEQETQDELVPQLHASH